MNLKRLSLVTSLVAFAMLLPRALFAAPGDILFSDNFNDNNLAPWTTTDPSVSGILTGGQTSGSNPRAGYTSARAVTVTGPSVNAAVPGASMSVWVRRGSDAISEDTDANEDFVIEYRRANGTWGTLNTYLGSGTNGQIYNDSFILPNDALHANLAIRFRQTQGSGPGFDFWHFDDVVVTEIAAAGPLDVGSCDDFENGLTNWTVVTGSGQAAISSATSNSPQNSLFLNGGTVSVTSTTIDTSTAAFSDLTVWIRRGADSFSEDPDTGEDLVLEYRTTAGTYVEFDRFNGNGGQGQVFNQRYTLPAAARHAGFQLRIRQVAGSGAPYDFWHVDDVCLEAVSVPQLLVSKVGVTLSDPINGTVSPKSIPGAIVQYTVTVTNEGPGIVDADTLRISDPLPVDAELYVDTSGGDPIQFTDGATSSGLSFNYAADVQFSNSPGGTPYGYTPVPDVDGFDGSVTGFAATPTGAMAASDGTNHPSFTIRFLVRLR